MQKFLQLFQEIESTNSSNKKIRAIVKYFESAPPEDIVWTIAIFSHKRPKRGVTTTQLRVWAAEYANIPLWLFEETYHIVGDLAETIANVIPKSYNSETAEDRTLTEWIGLIKTLKEKDDDEKKEIILQSWRSLQSEERFLFNKLLTGGFRMGVSQKTIVKALSQHLDMEASVVAHKLMGNWDPSTTTYHSLLIEDDPSQNLSKPYPFYLAYAIDKDLHELGDVENWYAEYKWDGIRSQLIKRGKNVYLWSRGEEIISEQFPEFDMLVDLPFDFVIDGELLVYPEGSMGSFNDLQKRLGRKKVSKKMQKELPAKIMVYDIMEVDRVDIRSLSQEERRKKLEVLMSQMPDVTPLMLSSILQYDSWEELEKLRESARDYDAEGLMLKSTIGGYKTGRKKGDWYKWKLDPMTIDAVMLYAQRGHGRRANLYTDFTFAVQHGDKLVPFAKAYSGLTDAEFLEVTKYVRKNTIERFGPVSSVTPGLVFEIAFEGIAKSKRHKSGVALRFPRILRWRKDKKLSEINTLQDLYAFL